MIANLRSNSQMAIIYKAISKCGKVYIGTTDRKLSTRISEHKYQSKNRRHNLFNYLVQKNGTEYFKFKKIEECSEQEKFAREQYWINVFKKNGISLNKSNGGKGPNGIIMPETQKAVSSKLMKQRWKNDRDSMLKRVNAHKNAEFYKKAGLAGGYGKAAKQPWFRVYERKTNKLIGRFQTKRAFADAINVSESTTARYLSGKLKIGSILYRIVWE